MPIRKGRFHRNCKRCGKEFIPTGRCCWICNNCNPKGKFINKLLKKQNELKRKSKSKKKTKKNKYLDSKTKHNL